MATSEPSVNLSPEYKPLQVHVKTQDGQTHTYTVVSDKSTVAALKEIISSDLQIPPSDQRLIFQGHLLRDNQTLKERKCLGQVVHLVKRIPNASEPSTNANSTIHQGQQQQYQGSFTFTHTPQVVFGSVPLSENLPPNLLLQQLMQGVTQGLNQHLNAGVAAASTSNLNSNTSAANITTATGNGSTNNVNATSNNNSGASGEAVTGNNQNLLVYQRLRYARRHLQRAQSALDMYFSGFTQGVNSSISAQENVNTDSTFYSSNEMTHADYTTNIDPEDTLIAPTTSSMNTSLATSTEPEIANASSATSTQPPASATLLADIQTQLADISLQLADLLRQESDFLREDQPLEDHAMVQQMERLCRIVHDVTACLRQAQEYIIHLVVSPSEAPPRTISLRSRGVLQPRVQISINAAAHPININANTDRTTNTNNGTQAPTHNQALHEYATMAVNSILSTITGRSGRNFTQDIPADSNNNNNNNIYNNNNNNNNTNNNNNNNNIYNNNNNNNTNNNNDNNNSNNTSNININNNDSQNGVNIEVFNSTTDTTTTSTTTNTNTNETQPTHPQGMFFGSNFITLPPVVAHLPDDGNIPLPMPFPQFIPQSFLGGNITMSQFVALLFSEDRPTANEDDYFSKLLKLLCDIFTISQFVELIQGRVECLQQTHTAVREFLFNNLLPNVLNCTDTCRIAAAKKIAESIINYSLSGLNEVVPSCCTLDIKQVFFRFFTIQFNTGIAIVLRYPLQEEITGATDPENRYGKAIWGWGYSMICEMFHLFKLVCEESGSDFHTILSDHMQSSPQNINRLLGQFYPTCRDIIDIGIANSDLSDQQIRDKYLVNHLDTIELQGSDDITSDTSITSVANCNIHSVHHSQLQPIQNDGLISNDLDSGVVREKPYLSSHSDANDASNSYLGQTQQCTPPQIPVEWQQVILLDQKNIAEYQKSQNSLSNSYMKFAGLEPACGGMISCTADEIMCETLKLALKETKLEVPSSTEDMLNDLKQNCTLKKRYNEYIDSNLKKRLRSDPNYSGESFPNAEEYFKPNQ